MSNDTELKGNGGCYGYDFWEMEGSQWVVSITIHYTP